MNTTPHRTRRVVAAAVLLLGLFFNVGCVYHDHRPHYYDRPAYRPPPPPPHYYY